MKKHPVLFGLLLLLVTGVVSFVLVYGISLFGEDGCDVFPKEKIGVITIKGVIGNSKNVIDQVEKYDRDKNIKAVILRIDSPGGAVVPSQEIYESILRLKKNKKVVASMGSVAASGGYYIACASDKIIANPGTITGSIGVVMQNFQAKELLKKLGLKYSVIKSGKYKDIGSPTREMSPEEKALIQGVVDDIYKQFLEVVATGRKIPKEKLKGIAEGKIFTGRQALDLGLVDEIGDMKRSIDIAAKLAGIKGEPDVVYIKEERKSLLKYIASGMASAVLESLKEDEGSTVSYLYKSAL